MLAQKGLRHPHISETTAESGEDARHTVPSPPAGEGQGGGCNKHCGGFQTDTGKGSAQTLSISDVYDRKQRRARYSNSTPLPVPPPQGGRERCGTAVRTSSASCASTANGSARSFDDHKRLAELDRLTVLDQDLDDSTGARRRDLVHRFHRLDDQDRVA